MIDETLIPFIGWHKDILEVIHPPYVTGSITYDTAYFIGDLEPNYPLPVIRVHYEWGQNLLTKEIILLECIQGVYDES